MIVKITLILSLCSGLSMDKVSTKLHQLEAQNPGTKVTLRLDKKSQCDKAGNPIQKKKRGEE